MAKVIAKEQAQSILKRVFIGIEVEKIHSDSPESALTLCSSPEYSEKIVVEIHYNEIWGDFSHSEEPWLESEETGKYLIEKYLS